jgi:hypothetical protein
VAWVSAEGAATVEAFGITDPDSADVLGAVLFDGVGEQARLLARVHSHGNWIDWQPNRAAPTS